MRKKKEEVYKMSPITIPMTIVGERIRIRAERLKEKLGMSSMRDLVIYLINQEYLKETGE